MRGGTGEERDRNIKGEKGEYFWVSCTICATHFCRRIIKQNIKNTHTSSPLTSSCSSSVSSSLTTGLARVRPIRLLPFPRSLLFSLRPRRIFTFTERARGWTHTHVHIIHMQMQTHTHTPQDQHNTVYCKVTVMAGLIALSVFHSFFIFLNIFLFLLPSCASSFLTSFLQ